MLHRSAMSVLAALQLFCAAAALSAEPRVEFGKLLAEFDQRYLAGNISAMEDTALELRRLAEGPLKKNPRALRLALYRQGFAYHQAGRFADAEPLYEWLLSAYERVDGPNSRNVATYLSNLGLLYSDQGRYAEAEPLHQRAIRIWENAADTKPSELAAGLNNLGLLYQFQGRYAEAEPLHKRALALQVNAQAPDSMHQATFQANLGTLYFEQGRYAEAEPRYEQALALRQKAVGTNHPGTSGDYSNLSNLYFAQGRYREAEQYASRSLHICREAFEHDHFQTAGRMRDVARVQQAQGRHEDAEDLLKEALVVARNAVGPEHPDVAIGLNDLAILYEELGHLTEAERFINEAITIQNRIGSAPDVHRPSYCLRSRLSWKTNRRAAALEDLKVAMQYVERQRVEASGGGFERARLFGRFTDAFEQMVAWQMELGGVDEAFDAMERSRARSLLDQITAGSTQLLAGVPQQQSDALLLRGREAQSALASATRRLQILDQRTDLSDNQRKQQREGLQADLRKARQECVNIHGDICNVSPVYRLALKREQQPVTLQEVKNLAAAQDALLLEYLVGQKNSYVLVVSGEHKPRLELLTVGQAEAGLLAVAPGPLTSDFLNDNYLINLMDSQRISRKPPKLASIKYDGMFVSAMA